VQNLLSKILIGKEADLPWREEKFINSFCSLYKGQ